MRLALRLLAQHSSAPPRFLTPGNPTGLTGLSTHPAPRPALVSLYQRTLQAVQSLPPHSSYRVSVEATTKHRLSILQATKPAGHDAWLKRAEEQHPDEVREARARGEEWVVESRIVHGVDERLVEWDGEPEGTPALEGPRSERERAREGLGESIRAAEQEEREYDQGLRAVEYEQEPPLEARQIAEIEDRIGAGLIEEVIEVAAGELTLVQTMAENRVWEELVERAPEGQWTYFERSQDVSQRGQHTPTTQAPPSPKQK